MNKKTKAIIAVSREKRVCLWFCLNEHLHEQRTRERESSERMSEWVERMNKCTYALPFIGIGDVH